MSTKKIIKKKEKKSAKNKVTSSKAKNETTNSVKIESEKFSQEEKLKDEKSFSISEDNHQIESEKNKPTSKLAKSNISISKKSKRNFFSSLLSSLVGERREIGRYEKTVQQILNLETSIQGLTDFELREKTTEFRNRLKGFNNPVDIEKKLQEILPEAFAVVREASFRTLGLKHYPVQLIGGMVLHEGRIAEMKTGEGKTLMATLAVYLNSLPEKNQVHVVTVNDYLARRDASWMGELYDFLGLTIGVIQNQASFYFKLGAESSQEHDQRRSSGLVESYEDGVKEDSRTVLDVKNLVHTNRLRAYWIEEEDRPVDIVYGVNSEFGFDYLRDNMANTPSEINQRAGHTVALVDEVDSILIDEARTPLIISSQDKDSSARYQQFAKIVKQLTPDIDYEVDEKRKVTTLSDLGIEKIEKILNIDNFYGKSENVVLIHHLDQALKAEALFKKDKEYVVRDNEIIIVDENTGRLMFGRRYNQGLHQAIEAKEGIDVKPESKTTASITFQNYFRLYQKLSGMTGTAATEAEEFFKIYKLIVVSIPTNKPVIRQDLDDKVFKNEKGKFEAIIKDIKEIHATGQPILIGTTSIDKNLLLGKLLTQAGIKHEILNANNHEQEALIISRAGKKGAVTVATNIAGRGIDIKLGGEPPEDKSRIDDWKELHEEVKALGGLFVIGTERHESRRIDNQLRGRSGRQGDPGISQFYISLDDYIARVFGGDRVNFYRILPVPDDQPIPGIGWLIAEAQKKLEGQNFDVRKHVTEYDDVINSQRGVIYTRRKKVLLNEGFDWKTEVEKSIYRDILRIVSNVPRKSKSKDDRDKLIENASKELKGIVNLTDFDPEVIKILLKDEKYNYKRVAIFLTEKVKYQLKSRWEIYEESAQAAMTRFAFLRSIDILWTEHLVTIDHLQDSVRLRGYSQKDPLTEFKEEGLKVFMSLLQEIDKEVAKTIFKIKPELVPAGIMNS